MNQTIFSDLHGGVNVMFTETTIDFWSSFLIDVKNFGVF